MADDKMNNPEKDKNLDGATGGEGGHYGQQNPGRNPTDDKSMGQREGGSSPNVNEPERDRGSKQAGNVSEDDR